MGFHVGLGECRGLGCKVGGMTSLPATGSSMSIKEAISQPFAHVPREIAQQL